MTNQEVKNLATIATRYSEVNSAAKQANASLKELIFKVFGELLCDEDASILEQAQRIVESISQNTYQCDAVKYYMNLLNEEK